ncbi:hypothetical protein JCM8547_000909 [Rhodosporidiobolus lusitaniae]
MSSNAPETKDYLTSLPAELIHNICELASHRERSERQGPYLGLISKLFLTFARSKRFREIYLPTSSELLKFVETVEASPDVGAYVQELQIYFHRDSDRDAGQPATKRFLLSLSHLPKLEKLRIHRATRLAKAVLTDTRVPRLLPSLKHLVLSDAFEGWSNPFDLVHFHNLEQHKQLSVLELHVRRKSSTLGRYRPPVKPKKLDTTWSYGLDVHGSLSDNPAAKDFLQLFPSIFHFCVHHEEKEHVDGVGAFLANVPQPWALNKLDTLDVNLAAPPSSFDSFAKALLSFTGLRIPLFGSNAFDPVLLDIPRSLPYLEQLSVIAEAPSLTAQHVKDLFEGAKPLPKLRLLSLNSRYSGFYGPKWRDDFTAQNMDEILALAELKHVEVEGFMAEDRRVARAEEQRRKQAGQIERCPVLFRLSASRGGMKTIGMDEEEALDNKALRETSFDNSRKSSRPLPPQFHSPRTAPRRAALMKNRRHLYLYLIPVTAVVLLAALTSFAGDFVGEVQTATTCAACVTALAPLQQLALIGDSAFVDTFVEFCADFQIQDSAVCHGAVGTQAPILAHALRSISLGSPAAHGFCSAVMKLCPVKKTRERTVELSPLPEKEVGEEEWQALQVEKENGTSVERVRRKWESTGRTPFKVVHISDVHVDRDYLEGSSATCSRPTCCNEPPTAGKDVDDPAGKFGEPTCDTPEPLVSSMMKAVEEFASDRAFTIFTGDIVDAAVWQVDQQGVTSDLEAWGLNMNSLSSSTTSTSSSSGSSNTNGSAPVYSVIGNHDVAPVNAFPLNTSAHFSSAQWVFDVNAKEWEPWIGSAGAEQVRTKSGCYSHVHPGTSLRIISLNTNYWYKQNFWLYDTDTPTWDPNGILTWLAEELDQAEQDELRVWIIGHMAPGASDTTRDQSNYANQIFQRYSSTIAAHFYGHSHNDEWKIGYEDYDNRTAETAMEIAFIGGAVTPTSGNPVFRVYDIDPDTYEVMDFRPIYVNMTATSFQTSPEWTVYYSAREAYGNMLDPPHPANVSLNPSFWHRVTDVLEHNETAYELHGTRMKRGGEVTECSGSCKTQRICGLRAMRVEDNCGDIQPGISFTKRDTLPSPGTSPFLRQLPWLDDDEADSCEAPGLTSMLRKLGATVTMPSDKRKRSLPGVRLGETAEEVEVPLLLAFQHYASDAVARHSRKDRAWWS